MAHDIARKGAGLPEISPLAAAANRNSMIQYMAYHATRDQAARKKVFQEFGFDELRTLSDQVVTAYKERNKELLVKDKPGITPEERLYLSQQMQPIRPEDIGLTPEVVADVRGRIAKMQNAWRAAGLEGDVFSDPQTARVVNILTRDAGTGAAYMMQGDPEMETGVLTDIAAFGLSAVDTAATEAVQLGYGARQLMHDLGVWQVEGLSQGNSGDHYAQATGWVQDKDGSYYHNGGKVGGMEMVAGVYGAITGKLIDQELAQLRHAQVDYEMSMGTTKGLAYGLTNFLASVSGYVAAGGPMIAAGRATTGRLAFKGIGALSQSLRGTKTLEVLASGSGLASGLALQEAIARGHIEGLRGCGSTRDDHGHPDDRCRCWRAGLRADAAPQEHAWAPVRCGRWHGRRDGVCLLG